MEKFHAFVYVYDIVSNIRYINTLCIGGFKMTLMMVAFILASSGSVDSLGVAFELLLFVYVHICKICKIVFKVKLAILSFVLML